MPRPGGEADKLGNLFEAAWTVNALLDVFEGRFASIVVEPIGEDGKGVEFFLKGIDGTKHFHSVKRQKQGGDWSIADLARPDNATGRSVLGDLLDKRAMHPNPALLFISSTGANELRELAERSDPVDSLEDFRAVLSAKLETKFDSFIVPLCGNDSEAALLSLKALEVVLRTQRDLIRTVEQRIDGLFYRIDNSELRSDDVRRLLANFVLENLGKEIDRESVSSLIAEEGIGNATGRVDERTHTLVREANNRYRELTEVELINEEHIIRGVVSKIIDGLTRLETQGVLLVAPGGYGKSCVLTQCLTKLESDQTPFLCMRMDAFTPCQTARQLGRQMDLRASPAVVLDGVAPNSPCVLVIDQLDAMSLVSGRHPDLWDVFYELCLQVNEYANMKLLLACRDFDLTHDHRLRVLGQTDSGFEKLTLAKLDEDEVRGALEKGGHGSLTLDQRQLEILSIPFNLQLFLQGDPRAVFQSVGELYERYWERKRRNVSSRLGRESQWNQIIDAMTDRMSSKQVLFVPHSLVDDWEDDVRAMVSEHVIAEVPEKRQYRFFHESFFDYAFARRLSASGRSIQDLLTSSEQHLFRRAQVRQILAYRREYDVEQYKSDLRSVLEDPCVRFHIKSMTASELSRIDKPTVEEWLVVEPLLRSGTLGRYVRGALRGHVGWFDVMRSQGVFTKWLATEDAWLNDLAIWLLESSEIHESRSTEIIELIQPFLRIAETDTSWRRRLQRVLSMGNAYKSDEAISLMQELIAGGAYDHGDSEQHESDFWADQYNAAAESPKTFVDILASWFDWVTSHYDDGQSTAFFEQCRQNRSPTAIEMVDQAAKKVPRYFAEQMFGRVVEIVARTEVESHGELRNRAWPYLTLEMSQLSVHEGILTGLRSSLQWLALNDTACFRRLVGDAVSHSHDTIAALLLPAWAENPTEFADECVEYLCADQRRLHFGYRTMPGGASGHGQSVISRRAVKAVSPHCSTDWLARLEERIIGFSGEFEREVPKYRGFSELLVLRALDKSRVSHALLRRVDELERKFPNVSDEFPDEKAIGMFGAVESPIPHEKAKLMSDSQWILAMRKYDGTRHRKGGGLEELSELLIRMTRDERVRYSTLAVKMPDELHPEYFSAILNGMCSRFVNIPKDEREAEKLAISSTPTESFLAVIKRLHGLPKRPCGSAIVNAIATLSGRTLPSEAFTILEHYATMEPDPEFDLWKGDNGGNKLFDGDPYLCGINTVRGQAGCAIGALLREDLSLHSTLLPIVLKLLEDPVEAVRCCAVEALLYMFDVDRDGAVELFVKACTDASIIVSTEPAESFIRRALHTHYEELREVLQDALKAEHEKAVGVAARAIVFAELSDLEVGDDAKEVREGTEAMRLAAANVYAHNLSDESVGDKCATYLETFFDDEVEEIRAVVASSFFRMPGERLSQLSDFIGRFIESRSFESETDRLITALEQSNTELPQIICRAAERLVETLGEEATSIAFHGARAAQGISRLVVRQYEQAKDEPLKKNCLNLIDRLEEAAFLGIDQELALLDR